MSFSSDIKKELCVVKDLSRGQMSAMLYGILFSSRMEDGRPIVQTENTDLIAAARALTAELFPNAKHETVRLVKNGGSLYTFRIKSGYEEISGAFGSFQKIDAGATDGGDEAGGAFLRGVFAACGSVTDPNKEYHLEICLPDNARAELVRNFISEHGMAIKATRRSRGAARRASAAAEKRGVGGTLVLYIKESGLIEDFLTYIGAAAHSLEIMQVKIMKDMRNHINRSVNCESANIGKTVAASTRIAEDIKYIYSARGEDALSDELRETARLRMENPELPLSELCTLFDKPMSRSGLNHRLKKISALAQELRAKYDGNPAGGDKL